MKWTVVWKPAAEEKLADYWTQGTDRQNVTDAADAVDHLLRYKPLEQGESRSKNHRVMFISPLGILYRVEEDDRMVNVLDIWRIDD